MGLMKRKGNILTGNVIYIVIVILFMAVLFIFVGRLSSGGALLEEKTAKKVALVIDSARPQTQVFLYVGDILENREDVEIKEVIDIEGNIVTVRLSEKGGYSYGFFNDVEVEEEIVELEEGRNYLKLVIR